MLCLPAAGADRTIGQFVHTAWVAKDGAPANIKAIAQTTDGYLWLASSQGLYRFDGIEFERFEAGSRPPLASVSSLLACSNGDLWAGSATSGITLVSQRGNRSYTKADGFPDGVVRRIAQDRDGGIWAATQGGLVRFDGQIWRRIGSESGMEGTPIGLYVDARGTLWVSTIETIYSLPRGAKIFQQTGLRTAWVMQMLESPGGVMWMAETTRSVRPMPPSAKDAEIRMGSESILFDRDGALWVTTLGDGLGRISQPDGLTHEKPDKSSGEIERFTADHGLSADYASSIFQDREGNIWVGTSSGLDRFTKGAVIPGPIPPNRITRLAMAPDADGDVWVADLSAHLGRIHNGQWFPEQRKFVTFSASPDPNGGAWFASYSRVLRETNGRFTDIDFPPSFLSNPEPVRSVADKLGALWVSGSFGVLVLRGGKWSPVDLPAGFPGKAPSLAYTDSAGRIWLGFEENAILLIDGNAQRVLSEKDGLRAGAILAISVRGASTWVAGSNGLQFFDGKRFRDITPPEGGSFGSISGAAETSDGSLWLNAYNGIIHMSPAQVSKLKAGENRTEYTCFDAHDGLPGPTQQDQPYPSLIQATDGKLWFATSAGPVFIDPTDIPHNALPPPVEIRFITAHGKRYTSFANLHLPKLTRDLDIAYTALSLTVPERVHFRYMLEGSDRDWREGGAQRQASYTNLGPGTYRFHVIASNNDGIWNEAGAALDFSIAPAYYQTHWFQAACIVALLGSLWGLYRLRLNQFAREFHAQLEGRVDERLRVARELHDTLLQSFHGVLPRLQAVYKLLPDRVSEAREILNATIDDAAQAITEARDAVQNLRSSTVVTNDLAKAVQTLGEDLAAHQTAANGTAATFAVEVEGVPRDVHPILRDEIYRIAAEAVRNAFKHARARRIEVEIWYGAQEVRVRVRDDGAGIEADLPGQEAREGHFGLPGMRERAEHIHGKLEVWSERGAGTEVELRLPASVAYAHKPDSRSIFTRNASKRR